MVTSIILGNFTYTIYVKKREIKAFNNQSNKDSSKCWFHRKKKEKPDTDNKVETAEGDKFDKLRRDGRGRRDAAKRTPVDPRVERMNARQG